MIYSLADQKAFTNLCLTAWQENTEFWRSTRKIHGSIRDYIAKVIDNLPHHDSLKIVDVGCGNGWLFPEIVINYKNTTYCGIDNNNLFIDKLKAEYPQNNYLQLDFNLSIDAFVTNKFNIIVSCLSLIEMTDIKQVFNNYKKLLLPGGTVILITLNPYVELIRLSENYKSLLEDFTIFRSISDPKFYRKEIMVNGEHSGKFYYGVLHSTEDLLKNIFLNDLIVSNFEELNFLSKNALDPIYHAYTLKS